MISHGFVRQSKRALSLMLLYLYGRTQETEIITKLASNPELLLLGQTMFAAFPAVDNIFRNQSFEIAHTTQDYFKP